MNMSDGQSCFSSNPWQTQHQSSPGLTYDNVGYPYGPSSGERALTLFGDSSPVTTAPRPRGGGLSQGLITRQMVLEQYETVKEDKLSRERLNAVRVVHGIKKVAIFKRFGNEQQAESSRAKKAPTPNDVRDPESMSGMKYQLHWDRERIARDKALRLLNGAFC